MKHFFYIVISLIWTAHTCATTLFSPEQRTLFTKQADQWVQNTVNPLSNFDKQLMANLIVASAQLAYHDGIVRRESHLLHNISGTVHTDILTYGQHTASTAIAQDTATSLNQHYNKRRAAYATWKQTISYIDTHNSVPLHTARMQFMDNIRNNITTYANAQQPALKKAVNSASHEMENAVRDLRTAQNNLMEVTTTQEKAPSHHTVIARDRAQHIADKTVSTLDITSGKLLKVAHSADELQDATRELLHIYYTALHTVIDQLDITYATRLFNEKGLLPEEFRHEPLPLPNTLPFA